MPTKRLRIFAGPNGSGKSVLYKYLVSQHYFNKYFYINADEISKGIINGFSFSNWPVDISFEGFISYLESSSFKTVVNIKDIKKNLKIENSVFLWLGENKKLTYVSAAIADYLRQKLLSSESSFACETVFSHASKIDFLKSAKEKGFKVYLYFIATRDPKINQGRVETRVEKGGHDVPPDKIESRYYRCLENLYEAIKYCDKVFLFDNSESKAEVTYNNFAEINNKECSILSDNIPEWFFKYVYDKIK